MSARTKDMEQAVSREFALHGLRYERLRGKTHTRWMFSVGGRKLTMYTAASPSCSRASMNAVAQLRRMIKAASTGGQNG